MVLGNLLARTVGLWRHSQRRVRQRARRVPRDPGQCSFGDFRKLVRSPERTVSATGVLSRISRSRTSAPALPDAQTRRHNPGLGREILNLKTRGRFPVALPNVHF